MNEDDEYVLSRSIYKDKKVRQMIRFEIKMIDFMMSVENMSCSINKALGDDE